MKSINLIFGIHNHKPIDCSDAIFEDTYQKAYKTFLSTLQEYPDMAITLYYSGIILEWLEKNHPEYLVLLREMFKNKQVELIGGGYFDPLLSIIPNSDKLGQIEMLTTYIRANFGSRPRGAWISEQEWEPSLAYILNNCGMEYLFLDDAVFKAAGAEESDLYHSCITEDQGKLINVFPISLELCSMIPEKRPRDVIRFIKHKADESGERIICYFGDGENWFKDNHDYSKEYKQAWLKTFLSLVRENNKCLKPVHPKDFLAKNYARRKLYFPYYSSPAVQKWISGVQANPFNHPNKAAKIQSNLLQGFKRFFSKYPESNLMYSKMLYTHILVNQLRGDKYRKKASQEELWRAQCNFAYWPGKYKGLYSHSLRKAVYRSLITAEKGTRLAGIFLPSVIATDFDMDGENEYLYQGSIINVYVHNRGGAVFELDYIPAFWNYLDTLTRIKEFYHKAQDAGFTSDRYLRRAFLDHFFNQETTIDDFISMQYKEQGNFINSKYTLEELDREKNVLVLGQDGLVKSNNKTCAVQIKKKYYMKKNSIQLSYALKNNAAVKLVTQFGVELNLSFVSDDKKDLAFNLVNRKDTKKLNNEKCVAANVNQVAFDDKANNVAVYFNADKKYLLWSFSVETLFRENDKVEKNYQATCFMPQWSLSLEPAEEWNVELALSISKSKSGT